MKFLWNIAPEQPLLAEKLARELSCSTLLIQCLLNRGLSEAEAISMSNDTPFGLASYFYSRDIGRIVEEIRHTRPDFILNNLVGTSTYEFLEAMHRLAEELLSNPVIENYEMRVEQ